MKKLKDVILACVDLSKHPAGSTLASVIESEKAAYKPIAQWIVEDWLRGLPSACSIPFWNDEIITLMNECGHNTTGMEEEWVDQYWGMAASIVYRAAFHDQTH